MAISQWLPFLLAVFVLAGCGQKPVALPEGRIPPNPLAPAIYGAATGAISETIEWRSPEVPEEFAPFKTNWASAPFCVIETELSPAVLVRSTNRYLGLFAGLAPHGLSSPSHVAWSTPAGPRPFKKGDALDVAGMEENWVLAWFSGAAGWTNWDAPWAIFLQHRPASMKLDAEGLHFTFSNRAGDVVLLPLYGAYKPPLPGPGPGLLESHGLPGKKIRTWEWSKALPRDPLVRVRFWAGASRRFPLYCEDSFSVNRADDSVTIRSRFSWHAIEDEWKTKPLKLAPLSPALALATVEPGFPVRFSAKPFDLEMFTTTGPYFGIPDADEFDATFSVLQYVHETRTATASVAPTAIRTAWEYLRRPALESELLKGKTGGGQAISGERAVLSAKALPYLEGATKSNVLAWLRGHLNDELSGPPQLPSMETNAAAKAWADSVFETAWAYAHFGNDWEWIRQRWPKLRSLFRLGAEMSWAGFGRPNVAENGRLAAPCATFARLAYQAGDLDSYAYGCSLFARELVHLWAKQRGVPYFRKQQPIHSTEFMGEDVFITHLSGNLTGWHLDGPSYPSSVAERRYPRRWSAFIDADIVRFYRDYLAADLRRERSQLASGAVPSVSPWTPRLAALLLGEIPGETVREADSGRGHELSADGLATAVSLVVGGSPERYERLIPAGVPTPFVAGVEREKRTRSSALVWTVHIPGNEPSATGASPWPELGWPGWRTPSGGRWTFGQMRLSRTGTFQSIGTVPLNWNSTAHFFKP